MAPLSDTARHLTNAGQAAFTDGVAGVKGMKSPGDDTPRPKNLAEKSIPDVAPLSDTARHLTNAGQAAFTDGVAGVKGLKSPGDDTPRPKNLS